MKELIGHLRITASKCGYKGKDRRLKEQFINGINDGDMMTKIIGELTTIKKTNGITSEQVLHWAERLEAERPQRPHLNHPKKTKNLMF